MKLIWLIHTSVLEFIRAQKAMAILMILTICFTSLSCMVMLRMDLATYNNDIYLSNTIYNSNSFLWEDTSKQYDFLYDIWELEDMPKIAMISFDDISFMSQSEIQKRWKQKGNSSELLLNDFSVIMNEEEAKSMDLSRNDIYMYQNIELQIQEIWDEETIIVLSPLLFQLDKPSSSLSIVYEDIITKQQNDKLLNVIESYDGIVEDEVSLLYDRQQSIKQELLRNICVCIGIAIIGGINTLFLVWFWNQRNKKTYKVYTICGAHSAYIACVQLFQLLYMVFIAWGFACLIYLLSLPIQNYLIMNYEIQTSLSLWILLLIFLCLVLLHIVLFLPLYTWQEERI